MKLEKHYSPCSLWCLVYVSGDALLVVFAWWVVIVEAERGPFIRRDHRRKTMRESFPAASDSCVLTSAYESLWLSFNPQPWPIDFAIGCCAQRISCSWMFNEACIDGVKKSERSKRSMKQRNTGTPLPDWTKTIIFLAVTWAITLNIYGKVCRYAISFIIASSRRVSPIRFGLPQGCRQYLAGGWCSCNHDRKFRIDLICLLISSPLAEISCEVFKIRLVALPSKVQSSATNNVIIHRAIQGRNRDSLLNGNEASMNSVCQ